jgi:hypothetical protein
VIEASAFRGTFAHLSSRHRIFAPPRIRIFRAEKRQERDWDRLLAIASLKTTELADE